ncbi:hypothetical protein [Rhizobium rhizosphaerae]|uniref:hypothetical protein n=1 Tax=Xaviernesmea rhizosphaerae TaxID=1672749 RepID=UPI001FD98F72|nr:hypothetical protein [Xaviernesmea rhizosphaerae]
MANTHNAAGAAPSRFARPHLARPHSLISLLALSLALVSSAGCTTETGPRTPQPAYTAAMLRTAPTNVYPVIEGKLPAATTQMTNDEAAAQQARLSALSKQRAGGQISEAEYERRRKALTNLAETHGQATLDEIGRE